VIDADAVRAALPMPTAIAAVRDTLLGGLDPAADPPRAVVPGSHGQLLLMPSQWDGFAGVKVASVAPDNPRLGLPRIQGRYLLLDGVTLTPVALLDGVALTAVRTAAVSGVAVAALAAPDAATLVVFGYGPQARCHVEAVRAVRPITDVVVVGRDRARASAFAESAGGRVGVASDVASADVVACCTTARTPLFDGSLVRRDAVVVAVGSHEPDAVEVDAATVTRSAVVVEAVATALREAGDVIQPVRAGLLDPESLLDLATVVREPVDAARPRLFKSVGMAWEDLVLAVAAYRVTCR
jgi:ornithine cyclodeaminase